MEFGQINAWGRNPSLSAAPAAAPAVGYVTLKARGRSLTMLLDGESPIPDGYGPNLEEQARDNAKPVLVWKGGKLARLKIPVLFEGFADDVDQQPAFDNLVTLAEASGAKPAEVVATGTIPMPGRTWWIESLDVGASVTNNTGVLVRRAVTIGLVEPQSPTAVTVYTGAPPAASAPKGKAKTYTVKKGETLQKIAAKLLGSAAQWKQIGDLNDIRDPRKELKAGQVLRLP